MRMRSFIGALFINLCICTAAFTNTHTIDKENYYNAFASSNLDVISKELTHIKSASFPEKTAYEGALLMKKAAIAGNPKDKLSLFKQGNQKLESAIKDEPENAEYRFLRFMIQENAPGFLGYNDNMDTDKSFIVSHFKKLAPEVQKAILNYSKTSKKLSPSLFQ